MTTDILEHAGATVLPAGSEMPSEVVVEALVGYCITCLAGPVTELIRIAMHISRLSGSLGGQLKVCKLFYTSEPLSAVQEAFLKHVFGPVTIFSGLGSAEIGFWGVGNPHLTGPPGSVNARDYVYDTRNMLVEILPSDPTGIATPDFMSEGTRGYITVTSLQRLRNPLVRYNGGDIGSVHQLPAAARHQLPPEEVEHYRFLRMYGRDPRLTFTWKSEVFDYETVFAMLQSPGWNILQSQVILDDQQAGEQLEIRLMRGYGLSREVPDQDVTSELRRTFSAGADASFSVTFVSDLSALERSNTGQKVVRFVDKRKGCSGV
jgi:Coenzyme F390 synthetase